MSMLNKNSTKSDQDRPLLSIENLHVDVEEGSQRKEILKGVSLDIRGGEVHAVMGRNGSGKTSLACTIMGHPRYHVTSGSLELDGQNLLNMAPHERARAGIFMAFQYPVVVPGVSVAQFLRTSYRSVHGERLSAKQLRIRISKECEQLGIPEAFMTRSLNEGFSGGEKKRLETLQILLLEPKVIILDETDSGLDIDALKVVSTALEELRSPDRAFLVITHYQRMLNYIRPDHVHVFMNGVFVESGDAGLALKLEEVGYDAFTS